MNASKGLIIALVIFVLATIGLAICTSTYYGSYLQDQAQIKTLEKKLAEEKGRYSTSKCGTEQFVTIHFVDEDDKPQVEFAVAGQIASEKEFGTYHYSTDPVTGALRVTRSKTPDGYAEEVMIRPKQP